MEQGNRRVQYLVALSVSLASVTLGTSSAWPTPVLVKFHNNETDIKINDDEIAWMLAMSAPGFMAGSLSTRFISDKFGRRVTVLGSAVPIALGTMIVVCAMKAWLLYVTRFLWSFGTGMISTVVSIYLAEIADKDIRGTLSVGTRVMFNCGTLLVMSIGPFVSYDVLNYMLLVLPISYFIGCWWIPESPYYYLKEGRVDDARKELLRLRGYKKAEVLENELTTMQSDVKNEMRRSSSAKELFTGKMYRKAVIISVGLKVTQIMSGTVTVQHYLGRIVQESNANLKSWVVLIIFGAIKFVVGLTSSVMVDIVGRRPLLIYSYLGTGASLAVVGVYFFLQEYSLVEHTSLSPYGVITFVGIIASNVISTLGYNTLNVVIPAEIFPLNVKTIAMTSLNIFGGILSFIVARGYQGLKDVSGLCGVFWAFAGVAFCGAVFAFFTVPETNGKSLKEIQILLQGNIYDESNEKLNQVVLNGTHGSEDINEGREMKALMSKETSAP